MIKVRGLVLVAFLVLFSAMALVACGGDDDDDASGDDVATEEVSTTEAADEGDDGGDEATETEEAADEPTAEPEGDDEPEGEPVAFDPCGLLSQADVEAALGEPVQEPVVTYTSTVNLPGSSAQAEVGTCNYVAPSGTSSVSITTYYSEDEAAIDGTVEGACSGKEELDAGDRACWYDDSHLEVQMASNGHFMDIFLTYQGDTTPVLESLAQTAASNT